jgi:hypothetical protein
VSPGGVAVRKRKVLAAVAVGALALVGADAFLVLRPRPPSRVTWGNFERIEHGMSRAQVEAILGPASGEPADNTIAATAVGPGGTVAAWVGDEWSITVGFDRTDAAVSLGFAAAAPYKESAFDNMRWRLKRQWELWFP